MARKRIGGCSPAPGRPGQAACCYGARFCHEGQNRTGAPTPLRTTEEPCIGNADSGFTGATELLRRAYAFAANAHDGQRQEADGSPYIDHSLAVGRLLYLAGCREEVVAAGLLHDIVEDTDVAVKDIERRFGRDVSQLVAAMTEPAEVHPFAARKEALRRQVTDAGYEAEAIFAADKVVNTHTHHAGAAR